MQRLLTWFRTLGNVGAIENARVLLDQRRADDFAVRALDRRVAAAGRHAA